MLDACEIRLGFVAVAMPKEGDVGWCHVAATSQQDYQGGGSGEVLVRHGRLSLQSVARKAVNARLSSAGRFSPKRCPAFSTVLVQVL